MHALGPPSLTLLHRSWRHRIAWINAKAFASRASPNQSRGGLPRFYSDVLPPSKGNIVRVQGDEFWHITRVLRLNVHDRLELFNGTGEVTKGCIVKIDKTGLDVMALGDPEVYVPKGTQWNVYSAFGSLKGGRADWLIEKCTELGASSVTPLLTARSPSITENRADRWERVTLAATKQCQRLQKMVLNHPTTIHDLLPVVEAEAVPLMEALSAMTIEQRGILIIGPEGDFTQDELKLLTEAGVTPVGLGPLRLRVETATISLLSAVTFWADSQAKKL
ncbi:uncharacterized protein LOC116250043 isoform X2 [Nymphaea colorata]|uniref:uncharacterized protein LOC116250043 isoform X2 n=1 Tax=Nymphaea colorata TaxID=210225 RepID=UPI00129EB2D4|nr:uncharacterized protein LOC116250043 isoform X2 [Nymphaea colorata]